MAIDISKIGFHADNFYAFNNMVLLTGWSTSEPIQGIALLLDSNGAVVQSFAPNPINISDALIENGAILADGSIVIQTEPVPSSGNYGNNHLLKFNADGTEDASFGANNTNAFHGSSYMLADSNGGVFVGFYNSNAVQHYNADGQLDISFGSGGTLYLNPGMSFVGALEIHGDKLYVTGGSNSFLLEVFNLDGTPANIFSGTNVISETYNGGNYIGAIGSEYAGAGAIVFLSDNKFVLIGDAPNNTGHAAITLSRFNADGSVDSSFGENGVIQTSIPDVNLNCVGSGYHTGYASTADAIYVTANNNGNCYLVKYNLDGQIDQTFTDTVNANMPENLSRGESIWSYGYRNYFVSVESDGSIMLVGTPSTQEDPSYTNSQNIAVFDSTGQLKSTVFSSAGNIDGSNVNDAITGSIGNDSVNAGSGNDTINASAGNDTLLGDGGNDILIGGSGNDSIDGGVGNNTASYTDATSNVVINLSNATVGGVLAGTATGDGTDTLSNIQNAIGGSGNDVITASSSNSILIGGDGLDTLNGGVGNDLLIDGALIDPNDIPTDLVTLMSGLSNSINALQGIKDSSLNTNPMIDEINTLNRTLSQIVAEGTGSGALSNTLSINAVSASSPTDALVGGKGNDTYVITSLNTKVTEATSSGTDLIDVAIATIGGTYTLATNIENGALINDVNYNLVGNTLNNILVGNSHNNSLSGGTGNDTLVGNGGHDTLIGGNGIDTFHVSSSSTDQINDLGAGGSDVLIVDAGSTVNATVTSAWTATSSTVNQGIVNITTNGLAVNLAADTLVGSHGFNIIDIGKAAKLTGSGLDDTITGGTGNDTLIGGLGNDTLYGGLGNDNLTGGLGSDHFVFNTTLNANTNKDTLTDFSSTQGDKIDLNSSIFGNLVHTGSTLTDSDFKIMSTTPTNANSLGAHLIFNTVNHGLYYDADGSGGGAAIWFTTLSNISTTLSTAQTQLHASDFGVV